MTSFEDIAYRVLAGKEKGVFIHKEDGENVRLVLVKHEENSPWMFNREDNADAGTYHVMDLEHFVEGFEPADKSMKELLKIEIPLYRARLNVFFGPAEACKNAMLADGFPEKLAEEWYKDATTPLQEDGSTPDGMYHHGDGYELLWLPDWPLSIDDVGKLVHELEHATFRILNERGFEHTEASDEAYAYLQGWLYSEIDAYVADRERAWRGE